MILRKLLFASFILLGLTSCNNDDDWDDNEPITPEQGTVKGLYILNEGGMGHNNASLDYIDYETGEYTSSIFTKVNPTIVNGLGDVGNDVKIYGSKMYAVINASNYIEVMEAKTAKHIGTIKVNNGRTIIFDKGFAYISSFAGPVQLNQSQLGEVLKIDTVNLSIINKVTVGYQPEEMTIVNNKLYVANSGGYTPENYDNTVSVIDLNSFQELKKITVAPNLSKIKKDKNNTIWVTSTGTYLTIPPSISTINPDTDKVNKTIETAVSSFDFFGDNLYFYGTTWSGNTSTNSYGIIDITTQKVISSHFINSGTESNIKTPYALNINPINGDIIITDAIDYITPGKVYCLDKNGNEKWVRTAGIIPGHLAFLMK